MADRLYTYSDEDGKHVHVLRTGPYDPKIPVTCEACFAYLERKQIEHEAKLQRRRDAKI